MITKDKLLSDIKSVFDKYGCINRTLLCKEITDYNIDWQLSKYHGLKNLCKEIGLQYIDYSSINDDEIKNDVIDVYTRLGTISVEIYNKYGKYSSSAVKSHFGGFNNCLKQLGINVNTTRNDSKRDIEEDFWDFYEKYHTTSSTMYRKHGKYSQSVIESRYGSWVDFIEGLGLETKNKKVGYKKMIADVKRLYKEYGYLSTKLINDNCNFTYQAITHYISKDELASIIGYDNCFAKFRSKGEEIIYGWLSNEYDNIEREYTEQWLVNSKTGNRLYVDFYIPEKHLAIEYDGKQHDEYIPYLYGGSYKKFYEAICRDRRKEKLLKEHGIKLLRIKWDEPLTKEHILKRIENA